jgi:hypothetical protein
MCLVPVEFFLRTIVRPPPIVARLASQLDAQLITAEARRAQRAPVPDSIDLYFQGMACINKGWTAEYVAKARGFFERALTCDSSNIEATDNSAEVLAAAEAALTKALSLAPDHALAHLCLGRVQVSTNRAALGIAECERALALDRNLASAHGNDWCR